MSVNILRSFLKLSVKDEVDESKIEISLEEMSKHCSYDDCWIVIYDKVYDITNFISSHPGGDSILIEEGGRDCTSFFIGHSDDAVVMMKKYEIGVLPADQRIYRYAPKIIA